MWAGRQFPISQKFDGLPSALLHPRHRALHMLLAAGLSALTVVVVAATVMTAL